MVGPRVRRGGAWGSGLTALVACSLFAATGCGEGTPEVEEAPAQVEVEQTVEEAPAPTLPPPQRFLSEQMQRPGGASTFPHGAHEQISCSACHARIRGHGSHAGLNCVSCHRSSAQATRTDLTASDCMACHHSPQQQVNCASCHESVGPRLVQRSYRLDVWPTARTRRLPFDHARHEAERCEACHQSPSMAAPASCATCHEDHHRPEARCMTCHQPARSGAHELEAHLGCTGSGCHTHVTLDVMAQSRQVCLVCHQDLEQHEPGRDCAACHHVSSQDGIDATAGPRYESALHESVGADPLERERKGALP